MASGPECRVDDFETKAYDLLKLTKHQFQTDRLESLSYYVRETIKCRKQCHKNTRRFYLRSEAV